MTASATVYTTLLHSKARLGARMDLGQGQSVAHWSNAQDRLRYENTRMHTISLYTKGGQESRRVDRGCVTGRPESLCVLPQGSVSEWDIGRSFQFVHLYLPDATLRHFMAETLDRDPARLDLSEKTFHDDPGLGALMHRLGAAAKDGTPLGARETLSELCHYLLTRPDYGGNPARQVRGGLSRAASNRVVALMHAELDRPLHLADLAAVAGLSEFHFQRMFRATHGLSPHGYLDGLRIRRAETLIAAAQPLAEIAIACGYCHQSHLTRAFRKARGMTPTAWRQAHHPG